MLLAPGAAQGAERSANEVLNFDPAFVYTSGDPGQVVHSQVLVQNQTRVDATMRVDSLDMRAEPGASTALDFVARGTAPRGAGGWMSPGADAFTLRAGTQRAIGIDIAIPPGAGAGGHFGAIMFTARPTTPTSQFNLDAEFYVPVFVTVSGDFERELRVTATPDKRWRWAGGRARWTIEIVNAGDVHEPVSGRVILDGLVGGGAVAPLTSGILLPGERRRQRVEFELRDAPNRLVATARVRVDGMPSKRGAAAPVYVIPWWLLVLLVLAITLIAWRVRARYPDGPDADEWESEDEPIVPTG